jgi:hypothetical protein
MKTIESRYKRFVKIAFCADDIHTRGKDQLDALAKREFKEDKRPGEKALKALESVGCSRSWLLYGNGDMCENNPAGWVVRQNYQRDINSFIEIFNRTRKYKTISEVCVPLDVRD